MAAGGALLQLQFERGAHICHLFESTQEQMAVTTRFFNDGLALGEYCAYVAPDQSLEDCYLELQAYGIDVPTERAKGALEVFSGPDYRGTGEFNSLVKARELLGLIDSKRGDFTGLRIVGDVGWTLNPQLAVDRLCHWEATANLVFEDTDARAICQYDLKRHLPAALHAALRTHRIVIFEGQARQNPLYEASEILANEPDLNQSDADALKIEDMLTRLRNS